MQRIRLLTDIQSNVRRQFDEIEREFDAFFFVQGEISRRF